MRKTDNETTPIDVAIYVRSSTNDRDEGMASLRAQEAVCRAALDRRFGRGQYRAVVYRDQRAGACGVGRDWREQCPALARMHVAIQEGAHQIICVWELSRRRPRMAGSNLSARSGRPCQRNRPDYSGPRTAMKPAQ